MINVIYVTNSLVFNMGVATHVDVLQEKNIQKILKFESWVEENCLRKIKCMLEITH